MSHENSETIKIKAHYNTDAAMSAEELLVLEKISLMNDPQISGDERNERALELFQMYLDTENPKVKSLLKHYITIIDESVLAGDSSQED
jgi:hypothetical protein